MMACEERPRLRGPASLTIVGPEALSVDVSCFSRLAARYSLMVLPLARALDSAAPSMLSAEVRILNTKKTATPAMHPMRAAVPSHVYIVCFC